MSVIRKEPIPYLNVPLSDALLTVDTRDGLRVDKATGYYIQNGQSPYDINIYKSQTLFSGAVERIALTEINMPFNIPNVNNTNNILVLKNSSGTEVTITLEERFYTAVELAEAVRKELNDYQGNFTAPVFGSLWDCYYSPKGYAEAFTANYPAWNVSTAYVVGDKVNYDGSDWSCGVANTGIIPVGPANWIPLNINGNWTLSAPYKVGDRVNYNGFTFTCILANAGNAPAASSIFWTQINNYVEATTLGGSTFVIESLPSQSFIESGSFTQVSFTISPKLSVLPPGKRSTLASVMGFDNAPLTFGTNLNGNYANCLYTTYIDIVSDIICKHQDVRDTSTNYATGNNILARVYISPDVYMSLNDDGSNIIGSRPFVLHYNLPVPKNIQWSPYEFLPSANIQLRDDKGQILYVPDALPSTNNCGNSAFVQLTFQISEAKT